MIQAMSHQKVWRKIITAILFTLLPPLFIVATTPISSLNEHISHIAFFAVFGLLMAGVSLQTEIKGILQAQQAQR